MLFLIFNINHFLAFLTSPNISTTISLMQINSILGEKFMTVCAFLVSRRIFLFHFSYYLNIYSTQFIYQKG